MALMLYLHFLDYEYCSAATGLSLIYYVYVMRCIRLMLTQWLIVIRLWLFHFVKKKKKKNWVVTSVKGKGDPSEWGLRICMRLLWMRISGRWVLQRLMWGLAKKWMGILVSLMGRWLGPIGTISIGIML
jgi:hypothetical protein